MKILFVCTHNRCRSILAEAVTNHFYGNSIQARSAGSHAEGVVHPYTLQFLQEKGIETQGLKSQSLDAFFAYNPDVICTVCDTAANEACPIWYGDAMQIHWSLPDPSKLQGSPDEMRNRFFELIDDIQYRVGVLAKTKLELVSKQSFVHEASTSLN